MNHVAMVIPAQEQNKYHCFGDLAPFGDTSLLEWKISQCKEFLPDNQIYIISPSQKIAIIAKQENINFILRSENSNYEDMLAVVAREILEDHVIWTNPTSPFLSGNIYKNMYEKFREEKKYDSLVSVQKKHEYIYYNKKELNFNSNKFISRRDITPIEIVTNGCYILSKNMLKVRKSLFGQIPYLFPLDMLEATEVKDITALTIANDLISIYFKLQIMGK